MSFDFTGAFRFGLLEPDFPGIGFRRLTGPDFLFECFRGLLNQRLLAGQEGGNGFALAYPSTGARFTEDGDNRDVFLLAVDVVPRQPDTVAWSHG